MAFLTSKEQYWRFKPFAELVVPFTGGDPNLKLEIVKGYVYDEGDIVHVLAEISDNPEKSKGFKQDGKTKIQWAITSESQRKIFGKEATTSRLEKHCYQYFKAFAGKYIQGEIYLGFDIPFDRYEKGLGTALDMCFEAQIRESSEQFDIPPVVAPSSGGGSKSYAPKETEAERLKAKIDFLLATSGATYEYWGEGKVPNLCEFVVSFESLFQSNELKRHAFSLWLAMNLAGATCSVAEVEAAIKYLRG